MKIAAVDAFYLAVPDIRPIADGTQDTFLVRIRTDTGHEGWGESDASPLVSLACYCAPPSHANIVNLRDSLLGERLEDVADLHRIRARALRRALDIQHVHHAFSAADIALWDVLGKRLDEPVWRLLDGPAARPGPKRPYASSLFGATLEETRARAAASRAAGFDAAKLGWGPLGRDGADADQALVAAARDGLGPDALLLVDAGWAWGTDVETALARAASFAEHGVGWLEEPLLPDAIEAYGALAARGPAVPIAAGESSGRLRDAEDFVANGGVRVLQIDAGRIGGITPAHAARGLAERAGISYVNHTFKSHLSLAAALHAFATVDRFELLEFAVGGSALAEELVSDPLTRAGDGTVSLPDRPGLGVTVDEQVVRRFLRPVSIAVAGEELAAALQAL
ncbi:MAG TPA: mandelate racemase/muconate lactonizing enzyme family protein [Solirubrobacteraceae bacterium]|nr:mandelate racemase/muconate lactonizing enzyme family protein [Solirubrobacteraceae bacterium]